MESNLALKNKRKIVEELVEKQEMWIFTDTECQVDKKVVFTWNTFFQAFQDKWFQVLIQDDLSTELRKIIYKNISKSGLHRATAKTPVLPCSDVIEWITRRVDHERRIILLSWSILRVIHSITTEHGKTGVLAATRCSPDLEIFLYMPLLSLVFRSSYRKNWNSLVWNAWNRVFYLKETFLSTWHSVSMGSSMVFLLFFKTNLDSIFLLKQKISHDTFILFH